MADPFLGRELGPYRLRSVLGKGGMGKVYLAEGPEGTPAAVKVLPHEDGAAGSLSIRFQREIQACVELDHVHVVRLFEAGSAEDCDWYAMEVLDGESLQQLLRRRGRLPRGEVLRIARELAEALDYIHGRGILHRDIKPGNVMVVRSGRTVLMDFGLAKVLDRTRITKTGHGLGTPRYMAPEMLLAREPSPATDLYQLGVVLYEMLSGETAVKAKSFATLAHELTRVYPPALRRLDPAIPEPLDMLVFNCLEKEPEDRYPTARAFLEDLARVEAGEAVSRTGSGATLPMGPDASEGDLPTAELRRPPEAPVGSDVRTAVGPRVASGGHRPESAVADGAAAPGDEPRPGAGGEDSLGVSFQSLSNPVVVHSATRGVALGVLAVLTLIAGAWLLGPGRAVDHRLHEPVRVRVSPRGASLEVHPVADVTPRLVVSPEGEGERREAEPSETRGARVLYEVAPLPPGRYEAALVFSDGVVRHPTRFEVPEDGRVPDPELRWSSEREAVLGVRFGFPVEGEVRFRVGGEAETVALPPSPEPVRELPLRFSSPFATVRGLRVLVRGAAGWSRELGPFDFEGLDGQLIEALEAFDPLRALANARVDLGSDVAGAREALGRLRDELDARGWIARVDRFRPHSQAFFGSAEVSPERKTALYDALGSARPLDFLARRAQLPPPLDLGRILEEYVPESSRLSFEGPGTLRVPEGWQDERHVWVRGNDVFRPEGVDPGRFAAALARWQEARGPVRTVHDEGSVALWLPDPLPGTVEVEFQVANLHPEYYVVLECNEALTLYAHDARASMVVPEEGAGAGTLGVSRFVFRVPPEALRVGRNALRVRLATLGGTGPSCPVARHLAVYYRRPSSPGPPGRGG